ncbi:MAG: cupin domain-containing protein [Fimbriimonas sp.]|nr:cupin domain-containing protein [Fimbriimonas sp.]
MHLAMRSLGILASAFCFAACSAGQDGAKHSAPATVKVEQILKSKKSWNGQSLPAYGEKKAEVTLLKITIPAGQRLKPHLHPVINAAYLLEGRLKVVTEKHDTRIFKAGDGLVEVVNTVHFGESLGPGPAVLIVFYAGHPDVPITIVKGK